MENLILKYLYNHFKEDIYRKIRLELNSFIELKDGYYPIKCNYIDDKIATFSDDCKNRDKIKFFRDLK